MKLFLISQKQNMNYGTYDSAVVAAPDAETARNMHPSTGNPVTSEQVNEGFSSWCDDIKNVSVIYIGEADEHIVQGVVCASFNA